MGADKGFHPATQGESAAGERFAEALRPHYGAVLAYCRALCSGESAEEAEDILQQALLIALARHGSLRDAARFRPWLLRIVTREFYRAQRRRFWTSIVPIERALGIPTMPAVYSGSEDPDAMALLVLLARLPARERAALLLFEVAGLSIAEIREVQGDRSISAVKTRLARARSKLRRQLADPAPPGPSDRNVARAIASVEIETLNVLNAAGGEARS